MRVLKKLPRVSEGLVSDGVVLVGDSEGERGGR